MTEAQITAAARKYHKLQQDGHHTWDQLTLRAKEIRLERMGLALEAAEKSRQ